MKRYDVAALGEVLIDFTRSGESEQGNPLFEANPGGAQGSRAYYGDLTVFEPACARGGVIETTGAGDTFCGCVLDFVLGHGLEGLREDELRAMLRFANTAAWFVTTRKGAIRAMPDPSEVERILRD